LESHALDRCRAAQILSRHSSADPLANGTYVPRTGIDP
jgi:hypothetical protein